MRIMFVDADYDQFLQWLYTTKSGLADAGFAEQQRARFDSLFGQADFYSRYLKGMGHDVLHVYVNNLNMQERWLEEIDTARFGETIAWCRLYYYRLLGAYRRHRAGLQAAWQDVLRYQARMFRPHVIILQTALPAEFLRSLKRHCSLLVGEFASPLGEDFDASVYDLILSAIPHFVESFRRAGVPSEYLPLGFEASIADMVGERQPDVEVTFLGSVFPAHRQRREWLLALLARKDVKCWGVYTEEPGSNNRLISRFQGPLWGIDMFRMLRRSKLTLNRHIDVVGPSAVNMRMFEATGVGTCLVTDWKENLGDFFEVGTEVVAYRSTEECADLIDYYARHDKERERIARAGQLRCLREHTFERRARRLAEILLQAMQGHAST
jgi:hypothetical protein